MLIVASFLFCVFPLFRAVADLASGCASLSVLLIDCLRRASSCIFCVSRELLVCRLSLVSVFFVALCFFVLERQINGLIRSRKPLVCVSGSTPSFGASVFPHKRFTDVLVGHAAHGAVQCFG